MAKKVTAIPAKVGVFATAPIGGGAKRKVAGYARVSTDHDDQTSSYAAQVDYYTNYIKGREDWEFVKIYTDEGITATNTKKREGFNNMVRDALAGRIDLIVTKSVSRFARNTVDSLTTIRKLKEAGVEVYFEKENIWTLDAKGELLLTIMSSLAQEEARNISENTTWGKRKMFSDGRYNMNYGRFLGYDRGPNGGLVVNPEQAETVRFIYRSYLAGYSTCAIAKELMSRGIKAPGGGERWHWNTVRSILSNEKYKGDALLQKTYTADYLTKRHKINNGEVQQYYIEDDHEAIISPEVFERVQLEIVRRSKADSKFSGVSVFSTKIRCGDCGGWYGSKVWHSNDIYRRVVFRCNNKYKKNCRCGTPHFSEDELKDMSLRAMNRLISDRDEIITNIRECIDEFCDDRALRKKQRECGDELAVLVEMIRNTVDENARLAQNQEEYAKRYNGLVEKYEKTKERYDSFGDHIRGMQSKKETLRAFVDELGRLPGIMRDFDENLFGLFVEEIIVNARDDVTFIFKDGSKIKL